MAYVKTDAQHYSDIGAAIREKNGLTTKYKPSQMGAAVRALSGSEAVEWHQCPEAVRNYLSSVTYDPGDYSTSQIDSYAPATAVVSNYRPIGKTLGGKTYCNEVPGIETPFASGGKAGTLKPVDPLRWIQTRTWNVRDLGGWACDGGTVKYGKLFRGGYVTSADRAVLVEQLGIQHELDLRGANEGGLTASPLGGDVRYTCAAAYAWYSLTPADAWKANLRCVFDAVTHNEPVYFHCAAGADRTGTLACVLEGLLGMSQSDIDKDYELTTFYSGSDTDANARRRNEAEWSGLISALNSKSGSTFRDKCVTFAAELGFTADEINAFRAAMIDGTPETVTPDIATFAVTSTLSGAATDNTAVEATQYQPYTAQLTAGDGKAIGSVRVTMGGADITADVWRGEETNLYRRVTLKLSGQHAAARDRRPVLWRGAHAGRRLHTRRRCRQDHDGRERCVKVLFGRENHDPARDRGYPDHRVGGRERRDGAEHSGRQLQGRWRVTRGCRLLQRQAAVDGQWRGEG